MNPELSLPAFKIFLLNFQEAMPLHIEAVRLDAQLKREKILGIST